MNKYISILRGLNVGGRNKVNMQEFKTLYKNLGFTNVTTYIQSGNVIFHSPIDVQYILSSKLERAIERNFNFHVSVQIRSVGEFKDILDNIPYKDVDLDKDATKVLITFLSAKPTKKSVATLHKYVSEPEKLVFNNQVVYLYCPNGYGRSKLSNAFIENTLSVSATTRNLKTVTKLYEIGCS